MTDPVLVARVRGLASRRPLGLPATAQLAEQAVHARTSAELRLLARWTHEARALAPIFLDEDRRTLRAIVRALAANIVPSARIAGAIATPTLPQARIEAAARARTFAEMASSLAEHPLAPALAGSDLFAIEQALVRRYFELVRAHPRDRALATYVTQLADIENASVALLLATRGGELVPVDVFVPGGRRLHRAGFTTACRDPQRGALARAFAGTPLAPALFSASPSAFEDATLAWQLATQARLRRLEPLGLANVLWFVLSRRDEARRVRRAAWSLGGAA